MRSTEPIRNEPGGEASGPVAPTDRPRLSRQVRLEWEPVRAQHVLLAPEGVLVLNGTGATILELCDGNRTVGEIVEELRGRYEQVPSDEVERFLARLLTRRYVELGGG